MYIWQMHSLELGNNIERKCSFCLKSLFYGHNSNLFKRHYDRVLVSKKSLTYMQIHHTLLPNSISFIFDTFFVNTQTK